MAGKIIVSSVQSDTDNSISFVANTGATIFSANLSHGIAGSFIADGTITAAKIADGAIVATEVADGAITGPKLGLTSINANNIVNGTITTTQIASNTISNTNIATGAVENYLNAQSLSFGMRNRIINGAMTIDQRNAGAVVTPTNGSYTLDRWVNYLAQSSKYSVQQDSSANTVAGFTHSMKVTSLSSYSVTSTDEFNINQAIEGLNFADLRWGTANASTITVSFWVRSSLTGTFGGCVRNYGISRSYPFAYTIVSADTWERKTLTIPGDTTGTWIGATTAGSTFLTFSLGAGSTLTNTAGAWVAGNYTNSTGATSVVGTNGATWYITGVQLEKGSVATPFEQRQYGTELALCQRYYYLAASTPSYIAAGGYFTASFVIGILNFPTTMRATPTLSATSGTDYYTVYRQGVGDGFNSLAINSAGVNASGIENTTNVSGTAGDVGFLYVDNAAVRVAFQAEL